jgi:drug/metabolite transporter (DMT)-like permease
VSPSLALIAAVACAVCYGVGSVLEQVGARRSATATSIDPRLFLRLARELPYVAGLGLDGLGWALSLLALRTLPLFLVQSAVASSIAVTALTAWLVLHIRLVWRQGVAIGVIVAGLVLLAIAAAPNSPAPVGMGFRLALVVGVVALGLAGAGLARSAVSQGSVGLAVVAGLAFSGTAISARILPIHHGLVGLLQEPLAWALVAYGGLGLLLFSIALQRGSVTVTNAVLFAVETVVPTVIGVALLDDRARPGLWPLMVVGTIAAVAGAVLLALWTEPEAGTSVPHSPSMPIGTTP